MEGGRPQPKTHEHDRRGHKGEMRSKHVYEQPDRAHGEPFRRYPVHPYEVPYEVFEMVSN
ncbi:hypothetical protein AMTR_s00031p00166480 [Amborella trichopoda]|uniref:Uncharacterized protein n=1 Tax=Amborella trichopoda TaxID=13333 RepID=U5D868_AMBTC|nr:hypothetical protein AMTR_s00031p00166480 [Amborella trichopoda]